MRPLTDEETRIFFEKLSKYIGRNIKLLIDRPDGLYCFRLHKDRVYYISEPIMKAATNVNREELVSLGTCFGKFTKSKKFRLHVTCLDYLAQYSKYKIWIKPSGEMSYLYGNNILKAHIGRITENTPKYQGCVFLSMNDIPLGFGITAYSTKECRKVESTAVVAFHQADVGEYLRTEDEL
jgi:60S ribosome subunit biogenesis protein NIP7